MRERPPAAACCWRWSASLALDPPPCRPGSAGTWDQPPRRAAGPRPSRHAGMERERESGGPHPTCHAGHRIHHALEEGERHRPSHPPRRIWPPPPPHLAATAGRRGSPRRISPRAGEGPAADARTVEREGGGGERWWREREVVEREGPEEGAARPCICSTWEKESGETVGWE
jgi:hypothetical protein